MSNRHQAISNKLLADSQAPRAEGSSEKSAATQRAWLVLWPWYSGLVTEKQLTSLRGRWLFAGDVAVYAIATMLGFAGHDELTLAARGRFLATFVSFVLAWLLISPWIVGGVHPTDQASARLWRPALAALCAAPLGAWLRALWIGVPIQVVFVAVMGAVTAALMVLWRAGVLQFIGHRG
jgi:hypothetical protein